ncbi:hypothetical protein ACKWTF_015747 [Chironomus riparius]
MFFVKMFLIVSTFVFFYHNNVISFQKSENIFFRNLNKLLDYCVVNPDKVDEGTILGILIAKGQTKYLKDEDEAKVLGRKIEVILKNFKNVSGGLEDFGGQCLRFYILTPSTAGKLLLN